MAWSCALCGVDAAGSGAGTFGASKPWLAWTCTAGSCAPHSTSENTVLPWMTHLRSTPAGVLRKCVIHGKTVHSDVECGAHDPAVQVHASHGFEAPKVPAPDPAASTPQSAQDQAIEKATR